MWGCKCFAFRGICYKDNFKSVKGPGILILAPKSESFGGSFWFCISRISSYQESSEDKTWGHRRMHSFAVLAYSFSHRKPAFLEQATLIWFSNCGFHHSALPAWSYREDSTNRESTTDFLGGCLGWINTFNFSIFIIAKSFIREILRHRDHL